MRYWLHLRWIHTGDPAREQFLLRAARMLAVYLDEAQNALPLCVDDAFLLEELEGLNADLYARVVTGIQAGHIAVGVWYVTPFAPLVDDATLAHNRLQAAQLANGAEAVTEPDVTVHVYEEDTPESVANRLATRPRGEHIGFVVDSAAGLALVTAGRPEHEGKVAASKEAEEYGARPHLYQAYKQCEILIVKVLPLLEALLIVNDEQRGYPVSGYLRRRLLPASAAPIITGVVSDAIVGTVTAELEALAWTAREALADGGVALLGSAETRTIAVFNANGLPKTDVVTVEVGRHGEKQLTLYQAEDEMPVTCTPIYEDGERVTLQFVARDVPAWGMRHYTVISGPGENGDETLDEGDTLENAMLSVSLDPHTGSITIFDKRNGNLYEGLNHYQDGGDCGTLAQYEAPQQDTVIAVPTNSPLPHRRMMTEDVQALEVFGIYRVPESLTEDGSARMPLTAQFVPISVTTYYTLHHDLPRVDIETVVETTAKNHRFSSQFALSASLDTVLYDGPKGVERVKDIREGLFLRSRSFMTFGSGETAVSLVHYASHGGYLHRYHDLWTMDLTLVRSTDWSHSGPGGFATPEAQHTGPMTFHSSLLFHDESAEAAAKRLHLTSTPLVGAALHGAAHSGPGVTSLVMGCEGIRVLSVEPNITGEAVIIRGVMTGEAGGTLYLGFEAAEATLLDERDNPLRPAPFSEEGAVRVEGEVGKVAAVVVWPA